MGSAATCCTNIIPEKAIKGKDEVLSRIIQDNNDENINVINEKDYSKSLSNENEKIIKLKEVPIIHHQIFH